MHLICPQAVVSRARDTHGRVSRAQRNRGCARAQVDHVFPVALPGRVPVRQVRDVTETPVRQHVPGGEGVHVAMLRGIRRS